MGRQVPEGSRLFVSQGTILRFVGATGDLFSTSTQSFAPALLLPGVLKEREPVLVNPVPMAEYDPLVGSNQRARTKPLNAPMSTVIAPLCAGGT
jgi:hypothetical protein